MKKIIGFFIFTILFGFSFAETGINDYSGDISSLKLQIESLNKKNIELENRLNSIDTGIKGINDDIEKYIYKNIFNSTIDNTLSAQANVLTVFGILFAMGIALIGGGIGIYVTNLKNKTERMKNSAESSKNDAEKILDKIEVAKISSEETLSKIENQPKKLYDKFREQENEYIFERLKNIPEEISHVLHVLATRPLIDIKYFDILVKCFMDGRADRKHKLGYMSLILQHYPDMLFNSNDLYERFKQTDSVGQIIMFPNEISEASEKITREFIKDIEKNKVKFVSFLNYIIKQRNFSDNIYKLIYENLGSIENKIKFYEIIKSESDLKWMKIEYFGKYILEEFENSDILNDEQKQLVEDIKKEQEESTNNNTKTNP